jgi:hypothetical protein
MTEGLRAALRTCPVILRVVAESMKWAGNWAIFAELKTWRKLLIRYLIVSFIHCGRTELGQKAQIESNNCHLQK